MSLEPLVHAATNAVLDYLLVELNAGETLNDYLAHDPDHRALQVAFTRTLHDFTQRHPQWVRELLADSALTGAAAQTIGSLLNGVPAPQGEALAYTWVEYWNTLIPDHPTPSPDDLVEVAEDFVEILTAHLRTQPYLWAVLTRTHQHPAAHTVPLNTDLAVASGAFEAALREAKVQLRFLGESERRAMADVFIIPDEPAAYYPASAAAEDTKELAYKALSADDQRRFRQVGHFPADKPIRLSQLAAVWEVTDLAHAQQYANTLQQAGLLEANADDADAFSQPLMVSLYAHSELYATNEFEAVGARTRTALADS